MDQRGVADVSEKLYHRVTKYHAQIGANVKKEVLTQLEWHLLAEAKDLFHAGKYEEALNTFTHCLAVTEKTRSSKDLAVRGAIVHNIASCLHHLGELEAAQDYYEQAIGSFEKAETPALERIMYGDANKRRVDFVKERLIDIQWNRKPDNDVFLDENGRKKPIAAPSEHVEDSALSRRWGDDGVPPPPAWADETNTPMDDYSDYPYERKPAWLSSKGGGSREPARSYAHVGQGGYDDDEDEYGAGPAGSSAMRHDMAPPPESSAAAEEDEDTIDDEGQERARLEWLQYYMRVGNWSKASELVVTNDEREDLDYLVDRERRMRAEGGASRGRGRDGMGRGGPGGYELNDAACVARGEGRAAREEEEDDDQML